MYNENSRKTNVNFTSQREFIFNLIKKNPNENGDQILDRAGLNSKNWGRITELKNAGYITTKIGPENKDVYFAVEGKEYNKNDFTEIRELTTKNTLRTKIEKKCGYLLFEVRKSNLTQDEKQKFANIVADILIKTEKDEDLDQRLNTTFSLFKNSI